MTLGTHTQGFTRLARKMDQIASKIDEEVVIQLGYTSYSPKYAKSLSIVDKLTFERLLNDASIIVTHGGEGSLLDIISKGKRAVVVPRLRKFNEHMDDHQMEITKTLEAQGKIIAVLNIEELEEALKRARKLPEKNDQSEARVKLFQMRIKKIIEDLIQ